MIGQFVHRNVTGFAQRRDNDIPFLVDGHRGNTAIIQSEPEPGLGRELQAPADKIPDDIAMTDKDIHRVIALFRICPVNILAKGRLNPGSFDEKLLKWRHDEFFRNPVARNKRPDFSEIRMATIRISKPG